jgi:hypothetical protein
MNILMESGCSIAELSGMRWDIALVGSAVDERGRAAIDFAKSHSTSTMVLEYQADSFRIAVDGRYFEADELSNGLPNLGSAAFLLESTTLGFVEVFLTCRDLVRAGSKEFHLSYVEPEEYKTPRRREVLYRRAFELSSEVPGYRAIPGAAVILTDRRPQHGVFFLGFEERRLDVALEDFQTIKPSNCSVVFGVPAYKPGWEVHAFANNVRVLEAKRLSGGVHFCGAENPAGAYEILREIKTGLENDSRMVVAPIGTKPNGIGAALFAALHSDVGLLYDHPKKSPGRSEQISRWHVYHIHL